MATIKKRGNSYLFRCYVGYDQNGKQIEKTKTWKIPEGMSEKKAEKEALHQASLFEENVRQGLDIDTKIKFADFVDKWYSKHGKTLKKTTLARYKELMKRILPAFGHMYMDRIRPMHLMTFYQELTTIRINEKAHCKVDLKEYLKTKKMTKMKLKELSGVSDTTILSVFQGKNIEKSTAQAIAKALNTSYDKLFDSVGGSHYSAKTIQHYHRLLSSIFEKAVKWQYIVSNPCERVDLPDMPKSNDPSFLDQDEAVKMLEYLQTEPTNFRCAVEVLLYTGMRRGELLGLKWSDVDFEKQLVDIHQTSLYLKEEGIFEDSTKNYSSERILKVPASVILSLKNVQAWQDTQKDIMGDDWKDSGFIFTALDGSPMHPDTLSGWFHRFIESTDLPKIHLHSLRHTNATLMISNGVAVTTVAGQLGHANASTTTKIYAHAIRSAQAQASEVMEDLLKHSTITSINQKERIG